MEPSPPRENFSHGSYVAGTRAVMRSDKVDVDRNLALPSQATWGAPALIALPMPARHCLSGAAHSPTRPGFHILFKIQLPEPLQFHQFAQKMICKALSATPVVPCGVVNVFPVHEKWCALWVGNSSPYL